MEKFKGDCVEAFEVPFSEEVLSALDSKNMEKAQGLDDFTIAFWQHHKEFVRLEVMNLFKEFYEFWIL